MRHVGEGQGGSSQIYMTSSGMGTEGTVLSAKPFSRNSQHGSDAEGHETDYCAMDDCTAVAKSFAHADCARISAPGYGQPCRL